MARVVVMKCAWFYHDMVGYDEDREAVDCGIQRYRNGALGIHVHYIDSC